MSDLRITLRGVTKEHKKQLSILTKNRATSMNTEILFAITEYLNGWNKAKPEWFEKKSKKYMISDDPRYDFK